VVPDAGDDSGARSPFVLGFAAAVGVALAYLLFRSLVDARDILVLVGLSLFFAAGLDPVIRAARRLGLPRGIAVAAVFVVIAGVFTAFGFAVVPPLVDQTASFVHKLPGYLTDLQHNRRVADLDHRFHLINRLRDYVESGGLFRNLAGNVLSAGTAVATTVFEGVTVLVLTLYFMAYLDDIKEFAYSMAPRSRRKRATEIGTKITDQIGSYVAGNLALALLAGLVSLLWLWAIGAPFPYALAFVVALLDVVPLVGAALATVIVSVIVLISSTVAGIATVVFLIGYQIVENYVVVPRFLTKMPRINPVATIIGVLAGAKLLGVIGFLLALPLVAVIDLILREIVVPRQARH
jgi:predicted PurR-regulated permease PerM